jgi:hypothetical protein
MPIINLTTLQDTLGGAAPVSAIVTAVAARASKNIPRVVGQQVIFPQDVVVKIISGVPQSDLNLATLPAGYYWELDVFHAGDAPYRLNVIVPEGDGPFDFEDLIEVVPETALPDTSQDVYQAWLAQILAAVSPTGATGSFVSQDGKTITVTNGIITDIV